MCNAMCVSAHRGQKKAFNPVLYFQEIVSHPSGSGSRTPVLWKRNTLQEELPLLTAESSF